MNKINILLFICVTLLNYNAIAHPVGEGDHGEHLILAAADTEKNNVSNDFTGPTETKGIASIAPLGIIELGDEFAGMEGKQFRARVFTIEPGGVIGVHTHNNRPGYAYILSGSIVEHRNDTEGAITYKANSVAIEKNGVSHWWENISGEEVKALVVDIFTPEAK